MTVVMSRTVMVAAAAAALAGAGVYGQEGTTAPAAATVAGDELLAGFVRGKAALEDGLYELAEEQFRTCIAADGVSAAETREALLLLARTLHARKDYAGILKLLDPQDEGVRRAGLSSEFNYWRALAHYEQGDVAPALEELARGAVGITPGSEYAARMVRLRAWCGMASGETRAALEAFELFDREYPDSRETAGNLLDWAKALIGADRPEEATNVLTRLVGLAAALPEVREGRYVLGRWLARSGNSARAREHLVPVAEDEMAAVDLRARSWLELGNLLSSDGERKEGVFALRKGYELGASPAVKRRAGLALGRGLLQSGDVSDGVSLMKSLIAEAPDDPGAEAAQLQMAELLLERKVAERAVSEFQHYLETYKGTNGQARAYHGKGWGLLELGRFAEAAAAFSKAQALFPGAEAKAGCLFKVGDAHFANKQFETAADAYQCVIAGFPESPLVPRAMLQLGECELRTGESGAAEETFQALAARFPDSDQAEEAVFRVAETRQSKRQWPEAILGFDAVMTSYTNGARYAEALHGRGMVRYRLFRFDGALADFEQVLARFPESRPAEQAFYMRGMCHYWVGADEKALAIWRDFIKTYPDSEWAPEVLFWKGKYGYNHERYEEAEADFNSFVARHGGHPMADDSLLWAGRAASNRKEYLRAIELLARLVKEYPESDRLADARFVQADALWELGRYAEAILIFDEVIEKYPGSELIASAWGRKGDCQFTLGADDPKRYEESIGSYRVVAGDPGANLDLVLQAEYKTGRCLEKMGRKKEAFTQYYLKVIIRFLEGKQSGAWLNEASKIWFTRAAFSAAEIMIGQEEWRKAVRILQRIADAGVPAAPEARRRIGKIKSERWWMFY